MKWINLFLFFFIVIQIESGSKTFTYVFVNSFIKFQSNSFTETKTLNPYYSKNRKVNDEIISTSKLRDRYKLLPPFPPNHLQKNDIDPRGLFITYNAAKYTLFKLYTQSHPKIGEDLKFDDDFIRNSTSFNPNNPTRVIIHGWNNNYTSLINLLITKAYIDRGDFNIVSI